MKISQGPSVTCKKCTFADNKNPYIGGGGAAVDGNGTFIDSKFINNEAQWYGGAVNGDGTFIDSIFENNKAQQGGAVHGKGTFVNTMFVGNSVVDRVVQGSSRGGAVDGGGTFVNCTFEGNVGGASGGAVNGKGTFSNCKFLRNAAWRGGAVGNVSGDRFPDANKDDVGTFVGCVFRDNRATYEGGAVYGKGEFINSVFDHNSVMGGAGGAVMGYGSFYNVTFYGNRAENGGAINGQGIILNSLFYKNGTEDQENDIVVNGNMDIDYSILNHLSGAANYGPNNIMGDPKLVDPDHFDFRLKDDSPSINTGRILNEARFKNLNIDLDAVVSG